MRFFTKLFAPLMALDAVVPLLAVICVLSIVGTVVPQGLEPREYVRLFPNVGYLIPACGFDAMYQSWPFVLTLGLLFVSTLLCTLNRYDLTRKRFFDRLTFISPLEIKSLPVKLELDQLQNRLSQISGWSEKKLEDGTTIWFSASGRGALIGAFVLHMGLLLILFGGELDSRLGVEIPIRGRAGQMVRIPGVEGVRAASKADRLRKQGRRLQENNPQSMDLPMMRAEIDQLDRQYQLAVASPAFRLVFEELWVDLHQPGASESAPMVRNWNTRVSVVKGGEKIASAVLRVNEPFSFDSIAFYQSGWEKNFTSIHLKAHPANGTEAYDLVASVGSLLKPAWSQYSLVVREFYPDFRLTEDAQFISVSQELNNPACRLEAYDESGTLIGRSWAFRKPPLEVASHAPGLPFLFTIESADTEFESVVQMTSKPGAPLVWVGCVLFSFGLILAFYITYIELWVLQRPDGRVILAVHGNRHQIVLQRYLEPLKETVELIAAFKAVSS